MTFPNFIQQYMATHDKNLAGAKFNIGDKVKVTHSEGVFEGEVLAVGLINDEYEYAVSTMKFLAWECEMEKLS